MKAKKKNNNRTWDDKRSYGPIFEWDCGTKIWWQKITGFRIDGPDHEWNDGKRTEYS